LTKIIMIIFAVFLLGACSSSQKDIDVKQKKEQNTKPSAQENGQTAMAAKSSQALNCGLGKDQRSIEVKAAGKGCELLYTKFTKTKVVAKSAWGMGHCEKTQTKMKNRLEKAGFKCE